RDVFAEWDQMALAVSAKDLVVGREKIGAVHEKRSTVGMISEGRTAEQQRDAGRLDHRGDFRAVLRLKLEEKRGRRFRPDDEVSIGAGLCGQFGVTFLGRAPISLIPFYGLIDVG